MVHVQGVLGSNLGSGAPNQVVVGSIPGRGSVRVVKPVLECLTLCFPVPLSKMASISSL